MKRNLNIDLLDDIIRKIANDIPLSEANRDHSLNGNWKGFRECHIHPDWLLIYRIEQEELELFLFRTGTHSDLF